VGAPKAGFDCPSTVRFLPIVVVPTQVPFTFNVSPAEAASTAA
jgi:hypothetical protein